MENNMKKITCDDCGVECIENGYRVGSVYDKKTKQKLRDHVMCLSCIDKRLDELGVER